MTTVKQLFKQLTAYHHFLVFLIILTIIKITNVFLTEGFTEGLHFTKLGVGLIVISSILHVVFSKIFDAKKKYLHSLISTFLIILMLSHADPKPVRGVLVILLLYVGKFLVKYKKQNIFNPVAFTIGTVTLIALVVPALGIPPMDFTGIDLRFPIAGMQIPLPLLPIMLALIFNTPRVRKQPLAISYLLSMFVIGYFTRQLEENMFSYLIISAFTAAAVIVEPKTSPFKTKEQIIYGVLMALLIGGLSLLDVPNPIVIGLLIGNVIFFAYNKFR